MTETLERSAARTTVEDGLAAYGQALSAADSAAAAAALFADDSYWRDLVAFTWNLKTVEGPAGVADLGETVEARVQAFGFEVDTCDYN